MKYCILILAIFFCSCNSEPDYDDYLKQMGITLLDNYKVLGDDTEVAIGDFAVTFELKISDKDFENIISKIKQTKNYGEYKNGEYPNNFKGFGDYQITGFKLTDRFFYRKESTHEPTYYELVLSKDKTLYFTYAED